MGRTASVRVPPADLMPLYEPLMAVGGVVIGWKCIACGRLFGIGHREGCESEAAKENRKKD